MMAKCRNVALFLFLCSYLSPIECYNKYSEQANVPKQPLGDKPFRINKLNLIWEKANKRLSEGKVKNLFKELLAHDKEEIAWKRLKADGHDKDGLKEAVLRHRLQGIMRSYDLTDTFEHVNAAPSRNSAGGHHPAFNEAMEENINKIVFNDKKLNKLWLKAERAGFTDEELKVLKEEFQHQQEKLEEFNTLLGSAGGAQDNVFDNSVKQYVDGTKPQTVEQELKNKKNQVKEGYDRLGKLASMGPENKDFKEGKVLDLWRLAQKSDFTKEELESLKEELGHYEHRLSKLKHLQHERESADYRSKDAYRHSDTVKHMEGKLKQYEHKVNKIHNDLETRIMQRHMEL